MLKKQDHVFAKSEARGLFAICFLIKRINLASVDSGRVSWLQALNSTGLKTEEAPEGQGH